MVERDLAGMIRKLADLHGAGAISTEDFQRAKTRLLAPPVCAPAQPTAWPSVPAPDSAACPGPDLESAGYPVSPHDGHPPPAGAPSDGQVGAVLMAVGGLITLGAFLILPFATLPFLGRITGVDLALLASGPRWLALLWLVPFGAAALVAIAAWRLLPGRRTGARSWAVAAVSVSGALLIGHLAVFVLVLREVTPLVPDVSAAGYWTAVLGCVLGALGGALGLTTPPSPSVVLGVVGCLAALGGLSAAAMVLAPPLGSLPAAASNPTAPAGGPTAFATAQPTPSTVRSAPTTPPRPVSSQDALDQIVAADRASVDALDGFWVPQLWSKRVGLEADGIVYDIEAILASYRSLTEVRPGTLLLRSDDYGSFRSSGFYVAVMPLAFDTGEDALAWCAGEGLGRDDCIAKRILRNGSPEGSAMYPP